MTFNDAISLVQKHDELSDYKIDKAYRTFFAGKDMFIISMIRKDYKSLPLNVVIDDEHFTIGDGPVIGLFLDNAKELDIS